MLPFTPPLKPMLAKGVDRIPEGDGWSYEPKWDGFRVLVYRDGDALDLRSRDDKPLLRYFPEVGPKLLERLPPRCVVDGELVILAGSVLSFDALQLRLHPAESRVRKLATEIPARVILWDLLALGDEDLRGQPLSTRRGLLERHITFGGPVHQTPATEQIALARTWFDRYEGAGLDGIIAKRLDGPYEPGKRVMRKIKRHRTIDCVLAGFRWFKNGQGTLVGSLILGLYDDQARLHQLGVASSFTRARRAELLEVLEPLRAGAHQDHPWLARTEGPAVRRAGVGSRWAGGRDLSWEPLRIERVVEVRCNQLGGGRLRHPARFVRWRPDREPSSCHLDQLRFAPTGPITELWSDPDQ